MDNYRFLIRKAEIFRPGEKLCPQKLSQKDGLVR